MGYHLGMTMDIIDDKLLAVTKTTKLANQYETKDQKETDIFSHSKNKIRRIAKQNKTPGQTWFQEINTPFRR